MTTSPAPRLGGSRDGQDTEQRRAAVALAAWRYRTDHRTALADLDPEQALTVMLRWHVRFWFPPDGGVLVATTEHGPEVFAYVEKHREAITQAIHKRTGFGTEPE